ncbi:MAG: hypothetical protein DRJ65_10880 [Acidobacteria bacterium]|nr:MAG: hypothetical protein DRJ65_10880 [Acidobacteriota bacterium]
MNKASAPMGSSAVSRIQKGLDERSSWWDRILDVPWVWAALTILVCAALLLPSAGGLLPDWAPGDVAVYDILLPMDITVPDPAATEAMRVEAREAVRPVYDYEPRQQVETVNQISAVFLACRVVDTEGEVELQWSTVADLNLEEEMLSIITGSECSDELEGALIQVVGQLYQHRIVDDRRALDRRAAKGLVLRNFGTGIEREIGPADVAGVIDVRTELEDSVRAMLLEQAVVKRSWLRASARFLTNNLPPNLVYSRVETVERVRAAEDGVTSRSQVFSRGQILVRRGDKVTFSVARVLQYLKNQRQEVATFANQLGIVGLMFLIVVGWWRLVGHFFAAADGRSRLSMVFILMMLFAGISRLGLFLVTAVARNSLGPMMSDLDLYLWGLPFAAGAVTVTVVLGSQVAVLFAVGLALMASVMMGGDFTILIFALSSGVIGVVASAHFKQRSAFGRVGVMIGLGNAAVVLVLALWSGWPNPIEKVALELVAAFLGGPLSIGIASIFLPMFESLFGITTDTRLLELSNQNLPLLKRLSLEAPGTYQHSLAVGNLAEAGADAVGANSLLLRVCAYYHDVGKLVKPNYFVENQQGENPHDGLSPSMSALVIQSHVKEGLKMAQDAKLPLAIRQSIATHHGTKLIRYFFAKAKEMTDPGMGEVRESDYRYPGPKPHTKELGILLLADAVEAAARTIEKPSPAKIQAMISRIFSDTLEDGQLVDSDLTFSELDKVATAFLWVLRNMYHHRIDYPGFDFNKGKR